MEAAMVVALISSATAGILALANLRYARASLREQRLSEKRADILKSLGEFYGPLLSYLDVIKGLYRIFAAGKPKDFRTLTFLLNPKQQYETESGMRAVELSEGDKNLLAEIIDIEKRVEQLIVEKSGLVDSHRLKFGYVPTVDRTDVEFDKGEVGLLAFLVTHIRVLRLAFEGQIKGEVERYARFVYPREIDSLIENRIKELQGELSNLRGDEVP